MNILFVTPFYSPQSGGVATYVKDIKRLLSSRGHSIYVMHPGEPDDIQKCHAADEENVVEINLRSPWIDGMPIRALAAFAVYFIPTVKKLYHFIRANKIEVMSLEYPMNYMVYFYVIKWLLRIPVVVGLHGSDIILLESNDSVSQWTIRHIIRRADWVLAHSVSLLRYAHNQVPRLGDRCSYLHYGVECKRLRESASAENSMLRVDLPVGEYILTVAKLYPRKGIDVLLKAINILKGSNTPCRFVIVGDGPEEHRLKILAKELDIESMVIFYGDIKNHLVPILFKHCEFFVLPSRIEPFGIVLLEAMTFGKAIVATTAGGIPEFVQNGHNGLLVPVEDHQALAEQIARLIRDKDLREAIGNKGRFVVEQQFDYDRLVVSYEELFKTQIRNMSTVGSHLRYSH